MKIVNNGSILRIFNDDLIVTDTIPTGTYKINFSNMSGYSLVKTKNFKHDTKVYGNHLTLVDKILSRYEYAERNFGVMLRGRKGTGKSMTARIISERLLDKDIPTIIVSENTPGICEFLQSIEQPVFVVIDEFEKIFISDGDVDEQIQFLSLFDGYHSNKHFYLISINDYDKLNSYFKGRTGRFYYDIKFGKMTMSEISDYITDTVESQYIKPNLVPLLYRLGTNYDQLGSIAQELNLGESIEDILQYLNLGLDERRRETYTATFTFDKGHTMQKEIEMDVLHPLPKLWLSQTNYIKGKNVNYDFEVHLPPEAYEFGEQDIQIDLSKVSLFVDDNEECKDEGRYVYGRVTELKAITLTPYTRKIIN